MYDRWHDGGWGFGAWIGMGLMALVFLGLLAALVVYLTRNTEQRPADRAGPPRPDDAMRILDERFARGEIDAEEYNHRRELLRSR